MKKSDKQKKTENFLVDDLPIVKLKTGTKTKKHDPTQKLGDPDFVAQALAQCFLEGDREEFMKILLSHCEMKMNSSAISSPEPIENAFNQLKEATDPRLDAILALTKLLKF